jgi:hypothetical protein
MLPERSITRIRAIEAVCSRSGGWTVTGRVSSRGVSP